MNSLLTVGISGLLIGCLYGAIGAGFSIALGACRVVNFAHGQMAVAGAYLTYVGLEWGVPLYVGGLVAVALLLVFGMALHRFVIEPIAGTDHPRQIVVTVAVALTIESLLALRFGTEPISAKGAWPEGRTVDIGVIINVARVVGAIASVAALALLAAFLRYRPRGIAIRAAGDDPFGCELSGYRGRDALGLGFGLACAMGAAAGVLMLPVVNFTPYSGLNLTLIAFVVVVVAGAGRLVSALLAGMLLGLIESVITYELSADWARVATFIVMLVALAIRTSSSRGVIASALETR